MINRFALKNAIYWRYNSYYWASTLKGMSITDMLTNCSGYKLSEMVVSGGQSGFHWLCWKIYFVVHEHRFIWPSPFSSSFQWDTLFLCWQYIPPSALFGNSALQSCTDHGSKLSYVVLIVFGLSCDNRTSNYPETDSFKLLRGYFTNILWSISYSKHLDSRRKLKTKRLTWEK